MKTRIEKREKVVAKKLKEAIALKMKKSRKEMEEKSKLIWVWFELELTSKFQVWEWVS